MKPRASRLAVSASTVALFAAVAAAAAVPPPTPIELPSGAASVELEGAVAAGEVARYTFEAREDQWAEAALSSEEGNVDGELFGPGWRIAEGDVVVRGEGSMELGEVDDEPSWAGLPPWKGTYLVEVRGARGDDRYSLVLTLRPPTAEDCEELAQQPMNFCFAVIARHAEAARARAYDDLVGALDSKERARVEAVETTWRAYRDAECRHEADRYEGGSLAPTIYSSCVITLTEERTRLLERLREE